jgi:hypothetical protein
MILSAELFSKVKMVTPKNPNKTVHVSEETYNELVRLGTVKDSFNDVIRNLLRVYKRCKEAVPS